MVYAFYRVDIILKETALVGVVGGAGLGWQLQESLTSFNWAEVVVVTASFVIITLCGEFITERFRLHCFDSPTQDTFSMA